LPSFALISAPSADVVWTLVGGTRLFRSTDRGATWQERSLPDTPLVTNGDIAFVSDREGWITAPGSPATQCQTQSVAVWHTADGAATWERIYQSDFTTDTLCKGGMSFADAQRGWITLFSTTAAPRFSRTGDGGKTWTRSAALLDPPGFTTQEGGLTLRPDRVRPFGTTLLASASGQTQTGSANYAFRSTDDGATWRYVSTAPMEQSAIAFVTATRWLQIVPPADSRETTDAGTSWHAYATDYQQAAPIAPQIVFGDASVGYATVRGSIQRTSDGGAHWSAIKTPGT
jgi:photosystem II stability/assembly factor-like uncharacterized protein